MFKPNTPEQNQAIHEQEERNLEQGEKRLETIVSELPLESCSLSDLALTSEDLSRISYVRDVARGRRDATAHHHFYKGVGADGRNVRAIVEVGRRGELAAEISSPAFYKGWGGNHDFSTNELAAQLKNAFELPLYPARD